MSIVNSLRQNRRRASINPMESEKQLYEVAYLIAPSFTEEEAQNFHQTIKNEVQGLGGLIDEEGRVEKRKLSYAINKMREAYLAFCQFQLDPQKITALEEKMKNPTVLRFLIIKTKRLPQRHISVRQPKAGMEPATDQTWTAPSASAIYTGQAGTADKETPAVNIEEIDKKLEEILGK